MISKKRILQIIFILVISFSFFNATFSNSTGTVFNFATPPAPLRQPAEFEPMEGVLIRYPFGISYEIIAETAEDVEVVTIVASVSQQNYVISQYQSNGVNLSNCEFLIAPSDTYWTRDYGPWFVFTGEGELAVVDFTYNRPRPNDNMIPYEFAQYFGYEYYFMNLIHTGGNYMTDGHGISVSTDLVWDENSLPPNEINQTVHDYLGIHTYHVVPDVLGEYIKHIDCWAKFLSPDRIMIIEVPPSHSQYDEIEDAVSYFQNQTSCYGTPYKIYRIYTPNGEPYVNSLILNNKVLVPITGSEWDDDALQAYENALPGYEVLGFYGSWLTTDALHCRVKGIPDRGMLYIGHIPLYGEKYADENGFLIEADIIPYSGANLTNKTVCWRTEGEWNFITMQYEDNNTYYAYIPPQPNGTEIHYYIHAEDSTGRKENNPCIGASQAYSFISLINETSEVKFNLSFSKGWNLITLPVENNYTASSLYADIPACNIILSWNASIADFDLYAPGIPNDFVIENGTGYLIGVENDTFLNITGMPIESVNVPLYIGWNMLGWFNSTPTNASSLLNSIPGCNIVLKWNNSKEDFDLYAPGVPNNFIIKQGDGFLVAVDEQSIWHGWNCSIYKI
ncbi:MAG TPA: hypothetical protein ENI33_02390 [Thermoplasmatales archaeon]|nr:hypothetical protein [Thermoplasmatales archaeon]